MTDDSGCRVRELLPGSIEGMEDAVRNELEKESARGGPGLVWSFVATQATEAMAEALDIDAFEVIAQGWRLARELHEYTDAQKHRPGEHSIVSLGEHKFTTSIHPLVNFSVDGFAGHTLRFTLELAANFKSAALDIEGGRIRGVHAGECFVTGQLKYGSVALHKAKTSRHIRLPGRIYIREPGLAIA